MRRTGSLLLAGGLAVAALVVGIRPAQAAMVPGCQQPGQACVIVAAVDGQGQRTTLFEVPAGSLTGSGSNADVSGATYQSPGGGSTTVSSGTSVDQLITEAFMGTTLSFNDITFVEVDGPDDYGRHLLLTTGEWATPGGGGPIPVPAFYPDPSAPQRVNYLRDSRGSGDDQRQPGPDQGKLLSADNGALVVVVHTGGQMLDPTATASHVDDSYRDYALSCAGCAGLSTTWYFPDGTTSNENSPTYTFPAGSSAGSYLVAVSVENPSNGSFGWGQATVRAGPASSASAGPTAPTGTGGSGGGHHGSTNGGSSHAPNPHPGHGAGGSATASASPSATGSAGPTAVATPPPVPPSSEPSSSLYVPSTDGPLTATSGAAATPTATPTLTPTPAPSPSGPEISGVLLADAQPVANAPGGQILDESAPTSAAAPALDPAFRIDPLFWLAAGGVLLLGAGAASESARVRGAVRRAFRRPLRRWVRIGG